MLSTINRHLLQPIMAWRSGSKHLKYWKYLKQTQFDDPEVIRCRQFLAIKKLLQHAYATVPFYKKRFEEVGFHPNDFHQMEDLEQLPVLTKTDIRAHSEELISDPYRKQDLYWKTTSGSTGVPLKVALDRDSLQWKQACTLRSDEWSGWRLGRRVAKVWGNPEYLKFGLKGRIRNYLVDRAIYLDTLNLDEARMQQFALQLQKSPPSLLFGHAHSLYLIGAYIKKRFPKTIQPDGIISTAMILHDWQRQVIEEAFSCRVTNRYGCEEASLIASECEHHRGLHMNSDSLYAEVDRHENRGHAKDTGFLLVTDLTNYAMPLIRYKIGDVVEKAERSCACGRGLPMFRTIHGREADYVLTPNGKLISGISLTENFAMHIRGTAQVQIEQEKRNHLVIRLVPDTQFGDESHQQIRELVMKTFGPSMNYDVELVDGIPQEPSGKYRFCISPVATEYLQSIAA